MNALIPDEKRFVLIYIKYFWAVQNATDYHLGPVQPSGAHGVSFVIPDFNVKLMTRFK